MSRLVVPARLDAKGKKLILESLNVATYFHEGERRSSGKPYITHPLAVYAILCHGFCVDEPFILSLALLHDAKESALKRDLDFEEVLGVRFPHFSKIVCANVFNYEGFLGSIDALSRRSGESMKENCIRIVEHGPRVTLVKFADRLHNMRTQHYILCGQKQLRKARETQSVFLDDPEGIVESLRRWSAKGVIDVPELEFGFAELRQRVNSVLAGDTQCLDDNCRLA